MNVQYMYYVDDKTLTISLFNNSEKLIQIFHQFSQQIVEDYKLCWKSFAEKDPFSQPKSVGAWRAWAVSNSDV